MTARRCARPPLLALIAFACVVAAGAQQGRVVRIEPENPAPGTAFVITVELDDVEAARVQAIEPTIAGLAQYTGSDIRPGPSNGPRPTTLVTYRFVAGDPGRVEIRNLSVAVGAYTIKLGTWSVDVAGTEASPAKRNGSWRVADSVWAREACVATAIGPDGNPAACPTFAIPGAVVRPLDGQTGSFVVVSMHAGTMTLPAITVHDGRGTFELGARSVRVRALPQEASAAQTVGGSWRLELVAPRPDSIAAPGTVVSWELRAYGTGLFGYAESPRLSVRGPDGASVEVGGGSMVSGARGSERYAGARGSLSLGSAGVYTIEPSAYAWFDTRSGALNYARAPAIRIRVVAEPSPAWKPGAAEKELARNAVTRALIRADSPQWRAVAAAAVEDAWADALEAAYAAAGVGPARGALAGAFAEARLGQREALASAVACLMAGDRAEAYGMLLALRRSAFPPSDVQALVKLAAASFGNLPPPSYVLPSVGLALVLGLAVLALASFWYALGVALSKARPRSWRLPRGVVIVIVAGAVLLALAGASSLERGGQRVVALGGVARTVPSDTSTGGFPLRPGKTGRVMQSTDVWLLVELDEGGLAWITRDDAVVY